MVTLRNRDIMMFGGIIGKVLQNCLYIHGEGENCEMSILSNPDYIAIEKSENKVIKIYTLEHCAIKPMKHILKTYLAQIF